MAAYNAYTVYASVKLAPYLGSKAIRVGGVDVSEARLYSYSKIPETTHVRI